MASDSRARMVRTMGRLMQRRGYHATGLNEVVRESGAPKGSMYHHFPGGKEQLAAEAVRSAGAAVLELIEQGLTTHRSPERGVRAVVAGLGSALEGSGYRDGCPVATVALEVANESEPVRQACDEVFRSWEGAFASSFVASGMDPDRAERAATALLAALEGALLLSRTRRDTRPFAAVDEVVAALLG